MAKRNAMMFNPAPVFGGTSGTVTPPRVEPPKIFANLKEFTDYLARRAGR